MPRIYKGKSSITTTSPSQQQLSQQRISTRSTTTTTPSFIRTPKRVTSTTHTNQKNNKDLSINLSPIFTTSDDTYNIDTITDNEDDNVYSFNLNDDDIAVTPQHNKQNKIQQFKSQSKQLPGRQSLRLSKKRQVDDSDNEFDKHQEQTTATRTNKRTVTPTRQTTAKQQQSTSTKRRALQDITNKTRNQPTRNVKTKHSDKNHVAFDEISDVESHISEPLRQTRKSIRPIKKQQDNNITNTIRKAVQSITSNVVNDKRKININKQKKPFNIDLSDIMDIDDNISKQTTPLQTPRTVEANRVKVCTYIL